MTELFAEKSSYCLSPTTTHNGNFRISSSTGKDRKTGGTDVMRSRIVYQDMDNTCVDLENYFHTILNDPDFYSSLIYKFFNQHDLFQLMPYMSHFRKVNSHKESSHFHLHLGDLELSDAKDNDDDMKFSMERSISPTMMKRPKDDFNQLRL